MRSKDRQYLAKYASYYGERIKEVIDGLCLDPNFWSLTPEQREIIRNDLIAVIGQESDEDRFVRPLSNRDPRIHINALPFREKEYGDQIWLVPRWDGIVIFVAGGRHFRYGDPFEWRRSVRKTEPGVTTWDVSGFPVALISEGVGLTKVSDRFEFNQSEMVEFLDRELPKIGTLIAHPQKGGMIGLEVEYIKCVVRQQLRDAKLRFESQDPRKRLAELFGEAIAADAVIGY